jgi:hypothetical protein
MKDFLDFFAFRQVPDGGYAKRAFASTHPADSATQLRGCIRSNVFPRG